LQRGLKEQALPWVDSLQNQSAKVLDALNRLGPYEGADEYRQASINYVKLVHEASKSEIPEYIKLKLEENPGIETKRRLNEISPVVEENTFNIFDEWRKKQLIFANQFNFQVKF
jgi:hypothetical protein